MARLKNNYATSTFCYTLLLIQYNHKFHGGTVCLFPCIKNEEYYTKSKIIPKMMYIS